VEGPSGPSSLSPHPAEAFLDTRPPDPEVAKQVRRRGRGGGVMMMMMVTMMVVEIMMEMVPVVVVVMIHMLLLLLMMIVLLVLSLQLAARWPMPRGRRLGPPVPNKATPQANKVAPSPQRVS
jgi:hypothetical protein